MMKTKLLIFGLLTCQGIMSQNIPKNDRILEWADYYFMNQDYDKALSHYLKVGESIPLGSRRNFSSVYAQMGQVNKAAQILRPLVDSDSAIVKDYYNFASYLTNNDKLRDEYRRKAIRLPVEEPSQIRKEIVTDYYELLPLSLNTKYSEFGAHIINKNNANLLVYSKQQSKEYTKGLNKRILSNNPIYNLYLADWDSITLQGQSPKAFGLGLNSVFQEGPSSWDASKEVLYLTRSAQTIRKQKIIQLDLYSWTFNDDKKQIPQPLSINVEGYASIHPSVSPKDQRIYFASDRPGGYGGMDLYYADLKDNETFGLAVNLGPDINSSEDEIFPFVHQTDYLFFSQKTNDGSLSPKMAINTVDIRWHVMELPSPFDSDLDDFSFWFDPELEFGMFSSNRNIGRGEDDLYAFKFTPKMTGVEDSYTYNPIDTLIVSQEGILKNDNLEMITNDPLTAMFSKEAVLVENVHHGKLKLNSNGSFLYKNEAPTKIKDSFYYAVKSKYGKSRLTKVILERSEVAMEELPQGMKKTFLPIFYEFGKSNLLVDFKDRVEAVITAMKAQPEMIVELSSYSDCRGSKDYNLILSQQRNKTIIDYVSDRIGDEERIFGKAYGESTIEGNNTLDYLIIAGSFPNMKDALNQKKVFEGLGFDVEISKAAENKFRVIVDQANTLGEAQKILSGLKEKGYMGWINQCNCCKMNEEEHLLNRRTEFKIIRL